MQIHSRTEEEILDAIEKFDEEEKGNDKELYRQVDNYRQLYKRINKNRNSEYRASLDHIKFQLVRMLVHYGAFLKTDLMKDFRTAKRSLEEALNYEKALPIAYYRLGFLAYNDCNYVEAISHFNNAVLYQQKSIKSAFLMNAQQYYFANLYLCNSSLLIARETQQRINDLETKGLYKELHEKPLLPFHQQIKNNERILLDQAYTIIDDKGQKHLCSQEEAEDMEEESYYRLVLNFSKHEHRISFEGKDRVIEKNPAEMIRYFFLYTDIGHPAFRHYFTDIIPVSKNTGQVNENTYRKRISRINRVFQDIGINERLIESIRIKEETGYYYTGMLPFIVIHRTDDDFILNPLK